MFGKVHCPILSNSTLLVHPTAINIALVWPSERYIEEKQTKSETECMNVSNTADNGGITQSQARDTRYRRMQELNSLCISKQLCHLSNITVVNALFEPILECLQIHCNRSSCYCHQCH